MLDKNAVAHLHLGDKNKSPNHAVRANATTWRSFAGRNELDPHGCMAQPATANHVKMTILSLSPIFTNTGLNARGTPAHSPSLSLL